MSKLVLILVPVMYGCTTWIRIRTIHSCEMSCLNAQKVATEGVGGDWEHD